MRGDAEREFEAFVGASGPGLLRTAYFLTQDRLAAEDVLQTALERTAARWQRLSAPEAYARRVVVSVAADRFRNLRARPPEVLGLDIDIAGAARTETVELRLALLQALRALPQRQRDVITLRYLVDLDERETAEVLGVSLGTVKSSCSRGLVRLRELAPKLSLTLNGEPR